jgi:hypothetical protein
MSLLGIFIVMKVLSSAQKLDQINFKRYLNFRSVWGCESTVYRTAIPGHLCPNVFAYHFPLQASRLSHSWENHYFGTFADGTIISMYVQDYPPSLLLLLVGMVNPSLVSLLCTCNALQAGAYKTC